MVSWQEGVGAVREIIVSGQGPWIEVTEAFYPVIFRSLAVLSGDAGYGTDHTTYSISDRWREALPMVEQALADLSQDELRQFALGSSAEQNLIARRTTALTFAHNLLNDFAES